MKPLKQYFWMIVFVFVFYKMQFKIFLKVLYWPLLGVKGLTNFTYLTNQLLNQKPSDKTHLPGFLCTWGQLLLFKCSLQLSQNILE